jgi:hypothetical protein
MMSGNQLLALARGYIHEAVPDFWSDAQLLIHLNASMKRIVLKMQRAADNVFYTSCPIPTAVGIQRYLLPNGVLYTAAPKCTGKIDLLIDADGNRITKGDWRTFQETDPGSPETKVIIGNYVYLKPTPDTIQNLVLWYWYFPAAIVDSAAELDFLEGFEPLIALDAVRAALIKDEADLSDVRVEFATLWQDFIDTYAGSRDKSEPDSIPDSLDDPD